MRVYSVPNGNTTLNLGMAGENLAQKIVFDISSWIGLFGDGNVSLLVRRPQDKEPYPVALTVNGTSAEWVVSDLDTAQPGCGRAELLYLVGDAVVKSRVWQTYVSQSLAPSDPVDPTVDPWAQYVSQVTQAAADAQLAAQKAQEALEHPPKIQDGTFWMWNPTTGEYEDTGYPARGPEGPRGERGPEGPPGPEGPAGKDGMTQEEADERYLPLTGGEMKSSSQDFNIVLRPSDGEIRLTYRDGSYGSYVPDGYLYILPDENNAFAGYAADLRGFRFYKVENGDELPIHLYGLLPPEQDDDAVTKGYADQQYLNKLTGGTVEGVLNLKKGITVEDDATGMWFYVDENGIDSVLSKIQILDLETIGGNFYILIENNMIYAGARELSVHGSSALNLSTDYGPVQVISGLIKFLTSNSEKAIYFSTSERTMEIFEGKSGNSGLYASDGYIYVDPQGDELSGFHCSDGEIELIGKGRKLIRLTGVLDPVGDSDAANKKYVDAAIAAAIEKLKNP